jgi:hypothetical protein
MRLKRRVYEIGAIAIAFIMLGEMMWLAAGAHGLALANGQPIFGDFVIFWSAGRAALDGMAAEVHDPAFLATIQAEAAPGIGFAAPWNGPPQFLLLMTAFAVLPFPAAALLFLAMSAALYLLAAHKILPDARALIFAIAMPAALYHLGTVQSGLLIAGITGLALHWLDTRPRAAGALIALLSIKPHLAILWPFYLIATRRWRAFVSAALASIAFALVAGLAFGFDSFARFIDNLAAARALIDAQRISTPAYASLYANLLSLGAPQTLALGAQTISAALALIAGALVLKHGGRRDQYAAFCAITLLISPYLFFYDATLLGLGAAFLGAPRDRLETIALIAAWGAGLSLAIAYVAPLPFCPLAAWLVLTVTLRRRSESVALAAAPAPHT